MSTTTGSTCQVVIRDGHRELVTTFREFVRSLEASGDQVPEPETLRAVVAFLRQSLLPFADWEQKHLEGCAEIAEDTAFEHAFLNAEVDALAAAVAELGAHLERNQTEVTQRIRRHAQRIEAVLELHVQKAEDRAIPVSSFPNGLEAAPAIDAGVLRKMDSAEAHRFLLRLDWGILCTVGESRPYAVPVTYGFDGQQLYVASGPGRKSRNLERSPAVCLTVVEVADGSHWGSVVVVGEAHPVSDLRGKLHGLNAIRRQRSDHALPSAGDLARAARASIFRITPVEISGRVRA